MAKPEKRKKARELRRQGWSIRAIEKELGVSRSSVSRWISDIQLTQRQSEKLAENRKLRVLSKGSRANAENRLEERRYFQAMGRNFAKQNRSLHLMGCMLYWAEGSKDRNRLEFVNSDPNMMRIFLKFLRQELNVSNHEIVIRITSYTYHLS